MITYKDAGVNIEEGYRAVDLIKKYAQSTMNPLVLNHIGSFGAMLELPAGYKRPVLVSGTDGVGTKLAIAFKMQRYDTVGIDCVAMCVNDILCHGARPLFFLDYLACGKLEAAVAASIVKGVAEGCRQSGAALIGGETAEMPGFYPPGEYDLAGFAVGIVDKDAIIDGSELAEGDAIIGLPSTGVHSNGYSLVRKLVPDLTVALGDKTLGEILLTPTRIYVPVIQKLLEKFKIKAMCHITGGGFIENVPRMLPPQKTAVLWKDSYQRSAIFDYLMHLGVTEEQMYNTFNMGIGFMLCVDKKAKQAVLAELHQLGETAYEVGCITEGEAGVCLR